MTILETPPQAARSSIPSAPLMTVEIFEPALGLEGFVCIHAMGKNGASGGMRCVPDIDKEEVRILARAMTYKYAFFQIPQGGAKAGLRVSYEEEPQRRKLLFRAAARHLEPLIRRNIWSPWSDMNFTPGDLVDFYGGIGLEHTPGAGGGSSFRTAVSAFAALQAAIESLGMEPHRVRVAIEGFGSVARYLVPFLKGAGVKLVGLTTHRGGAVRGDGLDYDEVLARQGQGHRDWDQPRGAWQPIAVEELFDVETDVFIPCARVHSLTAERAERLRTQLVLPIANVPCTDSALAVLDERGIPYLPDFVVNGGGVCGHVLAGATAANPAAAAGFIGSFQAMVLRLLRAAEARREPVRRLAEDVADQNFAAITGAAYEQPALATRLKRRLGELPWLPRSFANGELRKRIETTLGSIDALFR
jgi:glutamate dehydrogenase/leucine dehydrogenase